jgi:asparagine synthase (glutamine-hydrolysing)
MLVENGHCQTKQYWHPEVTKTLLASQNEFVEEATFLLEQSVELHSRSDVPVGAFLSGGIDSSLVTALFCQQSEQDVHTFTMDFEGKTNNEGSFAQTVSEQYGTTHHLHSLSLSVALKELAELVTLMDEPMADSAIVPSFLLSRAAQANGIKVVLCGAGGDELFGGYHRHYYTNRDHLAGKLPFIPLQFWFSVAQLLRKKLTHYGVLTWDAGIRFGVSTSGVHLGFFANMLNRLDDFQKSMQLTKLQFAGMEILKERNGFRYGRMLTDVNNYLVDNVLALTDRTTMAASVEARVPLLDHRLVELVFGTNPDWNVSNDFRKSKHTLKQIAQPYLPSRLQKLPKTGFNAPLMEWMEQEIHSIKSRVLRPQSPLLQEIFNVKSLEYIWRNPIYRREASESLFMIYVADLWLEQHA